MLSLIFSDMVFQDFCSVIIRISYLVKIAKLESKIMYCCSQQCVHSSYFILLKILPCALFMDSEQGL